VPLWEFGLPDEASIEVEDLIDGGRFLWNGKMQHWWLDPQERPYQIWRLNPPQAPASAEAH
jgi:starch synthase (maltosyl-transferring)